MIQEIMRFMSNPRLREIPRESVKHSGMSIMSLWIDLSSRECFLTAWQKSLKVNMIHCH